MKWLQQAKAMEQSIKPRSSFELVFDELFPQIAKLSGWDAQDLHAWSEDLKTSPELTTDCLRALKRSWERGAKGVLTKEDWQ
jgi:hypothetical protein